jgi:hypothetical protein
VDAPGPRTSSLDASDGLEPPTAPSEPSDATSEPTLPVRAAAHPEDGSDLGRLVDDWSDVVQSVGPATRAVLKECRPIAVDGNVVTLGFPEAKGFLKDHAERRRTDVEAAIGAHLGRAVSVRAVATNLEIVPVQPTDDLIAEARRIFGEDLVDVGEVS